MTDVNEQLRRLKNTLMGAGHRLALLSRSPDLAPEAAGELLRLSASLRETVSRLERLLAMQAEPRE